MIIMFNKVYEKFLKTIKDFDLISKTTAKVMISTSGGKDANIMTEMLYRYQQDYRKDLELILVNAAIPKWKYVPQSFMDKVDDEEKKKLLEEEVGYIQRHQDYWEERGLKTVYVEHAAGGNDEDIYNSSSPCNHCFVAQKKALFSYLRDLECEEEIRIAVGITKWDILYTALTHILRANGKNRDYVKKHDPKLYRADCMHYATFSPYPKVDIGIPGKKIYAISPIVALSDWETRSYAKDLSLPVVPDVCVELFGQKFNSDKRYFDNYLKVTAQEEVNMAKNEMRLPFESDLDPLYSDYSDILKLLERTGLLPSIKEIDGILYNVYMDEVMKGTVTD